MALHLHAELWYKVRHPAFEEGIAYRCLGYIPPYSETGWAYLVFVTRPGMTYTVQVWRCTALPTPPLEEAPHYDWRINHRPLTEAEARHPWAQKPAVRNPDLDTDL